MGINSCGSFMANFMLGHPMYIVVWAIVLSPSLLIIIPIVKGMYDIAFNIPQFFKDLKYSREMHISDFIREGLREEVKKEMFDTIKRKDLEIEKLKKENNNLKGKIKRIEKWVYNCKVDIQKEERASCERNSFIESYRFSQFDDIT